MIKEIAVSELGPVVGGISPQHGVSCIRSYMGTTPDGSYGGASADVREQGYFRGMQSPNMKTRDRARGGFSGMQAARSDHAQGIHSDDMAPQRCGMKPAF